MLITEIIGWTGAALILGGYIANSMGWLTTRRPGYQLINLAGSALFVYYTAMHATWATMTLNSIWFLVAAVSLVRMVRNRS